MRLPVVLLTLCCATLSSVGFAQDQFDDTGRSGFTACEQVRYEVDMCQFSKKEFNDDYEALKLKAEDYRAQKVSATKLREVERQLARAKVLMLENENCISNIIEADRHLFNSCTK